MKVALAVAVDVTFDDGIGKQLDGCSVDAEIVEIGVERVLVRQRRAHGTQDVADVPRIAELFGRQPQGVGAGVGALHFGDGDAVGRKWSPCRLSARAEKYVVFWQGKLG